MFFGFFSFLVADRGNDNWLIKYETASAAAVTPETESTRDVSLFKCVWCDLHPSSPVHQHHVHTYGHAHTHLLLALYYVYFCREVKGKLR